MLQFIKIYNFLRRLIKRFSVKYYRQMSKYRISWSLIKLVESFSKLQLASAALTYHTVFAIVPIMSLMIAIAKGLGYDDLFVKQIQSIFEGQEIISSSLILYANSYLSNTKVTMWLGVGIGLILLLYSVFSIFSTIDATFNMLWNERGRSFQKLIKTFAIVLVMPFIVVLALVLWWSVSSIFSNGIVRELNVLMVSVSTYVVILFAAYKYIPKTKVKAKYAAVSACVCGSIFALMQYFSYHIISSFNYRNIYGDLASLMIFLLLIYFSWTVCLAGSKWNFFLQKADEQEHEDDYKSINHRYHKFLCLLVIERIESLHPFSGRFNAEALAANTEKEYGLPSHLTLDILRYLREKKIIFKERKESLRLSKRYSERTVGQMLDDLDSAGRNSDAMTILRDVHSNASFARLWEVVNGAGGDGYDEILKTPVSKILGIDK
ncbi:MAG: YihY/virulence factor BrkB family protein [Bacteroidales bacterium]|nr:YihY/virulence factor BrkB family protein [Bacteroidales bacterium]